MKILRTARLGSTFNGTHKKKRVYSKLFLKRFFYETK